MGVGLRWRYCSEDQSQVSNEHALDGRGLASAGDAIGVDVGSRDCFLVNIQLLEAFLYVIPVSAISVVSGKVSEYGRADQKHALRDHMHAGAGGVQRQAP